jgi:predicted PurR-regulated permease PerM
MATISIRSKADAEAASKATIPVTHFDDVASFWRAAAQTATIVMAALMFGAFLYLARAVLLPVLTALVVGLTLGPVLARAARWAIPAWLMALATVVLGLGVLYLAVVTLAQPTAELLGRTPELATAIKDKLQILDRPLAALQDLQTRLGTSPNESAVEVSRSRMIEGMITGLLTVVTPAAIQFALQLVLFFGTLVFFIVGRSGFRRYTVNRFATRRGRLRVLKILNDVEQTLSDYLIVVTTINLALGVVTAATAYLLGLPAPLLWGALAFGLNYIPYVGPSIMYVLLFVVGLLTYASPWGALIPPVTFMLITLVEGQIITPAVIGHRVLAVPALTVFLAIAFWAWLWGAMGALLATPILIMCRVALNHLYPRQGPLPG